VGQQHRKVDRVEVGDGRAEPCTARDWWHVRQRRASAACTRPACCGAETEMVRPSCSRTLSLAHSQVGKLIPTLSSQSPK
jgi:hypothetical protein